MRFRGLPTLVSTLALFAVIVPLQAEGFQPPPVVGTAQEIQIEPNLAEAVLVDRNFVWDYELTLDNAAFLKPRFVNVALRPGDEIIVKSRTGKVVDRITGKGPKGEGTFWGLSAFGNTMTLEFSFSHIYDQAPFFIDQVIVGDPAMVQAAMGGGPESVCNPPDFDDAICYQNEPGKWANVQASVGVMSVGGNPASALFCSGANISPGNHILTNFHCVNASGQCNNTEFVFKYYRTGCNDGSPTTTDWEGFRCDETVASSPFSPCDPTLNFLDFSLHTVIGDPGQTYGWATPDPNLLTSGEEIYIVQHPSGRPHEITIGDGPNVEVDAPTLRYYDTLDTQGGSSGSPVFRGADDKLVGLHHCGGCSTPGLGNRGMLMSDIYPLIEEFVNVGGIFSDGFESGDVTAWQ